MSSSRTNRRQSLSLRRRRRRQPSKGIKIIRIGCAIIWCLLAGAPFFGFSAFKQILVTDGVYKEFCTPEEVELWTEKGGNNPILCVGQDQRLNSMFAYAAAVSGVFVLPVSAVLDIYGPRVCGILASISLTFGSLLLRAGTGLTIGPFLDGYILGYIFLGAASPPLFMSSLQLSNSFPRYGGTILAILTASMDASSGVFLIFKILHRKGLVSTISQFFSWYLIIPGFIFISQFLFMPNRSFKTIAELQRIVEDSSPFALAGKTRGEDDENNTYHYKWYRHPQGSGERPGDSYSFPELPSTSAGDSDPTTTTSEVDFTGAFLSPRTSSPIPARSNSISPNSPLPTTSTVQEDENDSDPLNESYGGESSPLLLRDENNINSDEDYSDNADQTTLNSLNFVKDVTEISGVWGALHNARVSEQLSSFWFILIAAFSAITTLQINFFIASIWKDYMYRLDGDTITMSPDVKLVVDYFDYALPIGAVISVPFVGLLLDNLSTLRCFIIIYTLSIIIGLLQLISGSVWIGCLGITLFVFYRPLLFTAISDYAINIFGFHTFSLIYGLILAISGISNVFIVEFNRASKKHHRLVNPNPTNVFLLGITVFIGFFLIMYIWLQGKQIRRKQLEDEAESAPVQQMPEALISPDCRAGTCDDCICES